MEYLVNDEDTHTRHWWASSPMTSWGMRSGFWKMNFSEPCRYSLHITAALWVAVICRNIEAVTTRRSWKPFAQKARGFESLFLRQKIRTSLAGVLYFLPQSEALERPSATLRVAEWGSHLSVSHRGARSPVAERKIFVRDEYPSYLSFNSKNAIWRGCSLLIRDFE